MSTLSPSTPKAMHIDISDDRLSAILTIDPAAPPPTPADLLQAIAAAGIKPLPDLEQSLAAHVDGQGHLMLTESLEIAAGQPPVADTPAHIDLLLKDTAGESTSFYERKRYVCAAVDQVVATYFPRTVGQDGVDVYGKPLRRVVAADLKPQLGANVRLAADGCSIIAAVAGRVFLKDMRIWIEPVLDVPGDVDFNTGNITFAGNLAIHGSVLDLFKVDVAGSATIGRNVEAAEVSAGADLIVSGAILGKDKGRCRAGGTLRCRHATSATLDAGGDVICHSELADCTVRAGGRVVVEHGVILSGHIIATGGISAAAIGSPTGSRAVLEVGVDQSLREACSDTIPAIEERRRKAAKVRETIAPLLQRQKLLTPAQKERATELLYEADEVETAATEMLERLRQQYESSTARSKAEVEITQALHAGVVIRFAHCELTVAETITGEGRIIEKHTTRGWGAFLVRRSGNLVALPSRPLRDDAIEALARMMSRAA